MIQPPRLCLYLDAVARAGFIRKAAEKLRVASTALLSRGNTAGMIELRRSTRR